MERAIDTVRIAHANTDLLGQRHPHSWRVLLAAEIPGLPYESTLIEFSKGQHRTPEYLALNPRGKVPGSQAPSKSQPRSSPRGTSSRRCLTWWAKGRGSRATGYPLRISRYFPSSASSCGPGPWPAGARARPVSVRRPASRPRSVGCAHRGVARVRPDLSPALEDVANALNLSRQRLAKNRSWRSKSQGLPGPLVQSPRYGVQVSLGVPVQTGSFGEALSEQPVGVLVGSSLPGSPPATHERRS